MDDVEITPPQNVQVVTPPQVSGTVPLKEGSEESLVERFVRVAARVTDEIRDEASSRALGFLSNQKDRLAEEFRKTAEVFRESSRKFEERERGMTAKYVNEIAEQAERASRYFREKDLEGLAAEIEVVARKNPMVFLLSTFTGGFVLSRFLRSPGSGEAPQGR